MWGYDEESYKQEVIEEAKGYMGVEIGDDDGYVTKDSGEKAKHSDGVQRDTRDGKTLFPLMFPKDVPMKDQLIVRLAELYTRGAVKYGDRNWENSSAEDTLEHHLEALWRHFMNFFFEVDDGEDHAAAILWNVNAVDLTRRNIRKRILEDVEKAKAEVREAIFTDLAQPSHITPENLTDEDAKRIFVEHDRTGEGIPYRDGGATAPVRYLYTDGTSGFKQFQDTCRYLRNTSCPGGSCDRYCQYAVGPFANRGGNGR